MVDTSGFQAWRNKTQEIEKPNGKNKTTRKPNILQTFFSKLSDNKIYLGFSFVFPAHRISRTYKGLLGVVLPYKVNTWTQRIKRIFSQRSLFRA